MPTFDLPVSGEWRVIRSPGHHRFAYDLVFVNKHGDRRQTSIWMQVFGTTSATDSLSWEKPVLSPCDAEVVATENDWPDREHLNLPRDLLRLITKRPKVSNNDIRPFAGNHVVLHCQRCYVLLAHLRRGSVLLRPGQAIRRGYAIGLVGNSGLSLEPHLHFQVFDAPNVLESTTVPFTVRQFERLVNKTWEQKLDEPLRKGDRIRPAAA